MKAPFTQVSGAFSYASGKLVPWSPGNRRVPHRPADGTPVDSAIIQKVRRDDLPTGGLGIIEGLLAPGELIPPHVHAGVDEVTYVLAGEITAEIGGEVVLGCPVHRLRRDAHWRIGTAYATTWADFGLGT